MLCCRQAKDSAARFRQPVGPRLPEPKHRRKTQRKRGPPSSDPLSAAQRPGAKRNHPLPPTMAGTALAETRPPSSGDPAPRHARRVVDTVPHPARKAGPSHCPEHLCPLPVREQKAQAFPDPRSPCFVRPKPPEREPPEERCRRDRHLRAHRPLSKTIQWNRRSVPDAAMPQIRPKAPFLLRPARGSCPQMTLRRPASPLQPRPAQARRRGSPSLQTPAQSRFPQPDKPHLLPQPSVLRCRRAKRVDPSEECCPSVLRHLLLQAQSRIGRLPLLYCLTAS